VFFFAPNLPDFPPFPLSAYITFDILRCILRDHFHYDVLYVMNITDLDDKVRSLQVYNIYYISFCSQIILKARREYLFNRYLDDLPALSVIRQDLEAARGRREMEIATVFNPFSSPKASIQNKIQSLPEADVGKRTMHGKALVRNGISNYSIVLSSLPLPQKTELDATIQALSADYIPLDQLNAALLTVKDPVATLLDKRYGAGEATNEVEGGNLSLLPPLHRNH